MSRFSAAIVALILFSAPYLSAQAPSLAKAPAANVPDARAKPEVSPHPLDKADLEAFFDGIIPLQLERSDVSGATVLVMKDGQTLLQKGYGFADWEKKTPVDPATTAFRLASISKLFTWISVMQLVEQHKLDLDTDVNTYLDFQIRPAFGRPITLRNLMTHTAGFEEVSRNLLFTDAKFKLSLRQFLIENQPNRLFPPGVIPAYSNYGVGLGGYIVEHVSGQPFEQYVREYIFQPLGMTHSSFEEPLPSPIAPSEGYRATDKKPIGFEIFLPAPAGGVSSSAADMGRFAQALLNGGELDGKRILQPETLAAMWTPQFRASEALAPICMGFYQTWRNGLRFIGHDGDLIAFHSMFHIEPQKKLLLFVSYNSAGGGGTPRDEIIRFFADRYYPSAEKPTYLTLSPSEAREYTGTYQTTRRADSNFSAVGNLVSQRNVSVGKDGILIADRFEDTHGHPAKWKPIAKDLWQQVDDQDKLFFIRDSNGQAVRLSFDFAAVQGQRVPWWGNAKLVFTLLGVSVLILLLPVVASLIRFIRRRAFRRRPRFQPQPGTLYLTAGPRLACLAWLIVAGIVGAIAAHFSSDSALAPTSAFDKVLVIQNIFAAIAILLSVSAVYSGIAIWFREIRIITQIKFSLVALSCLFLTSFALHWHILGPAHRY
ncbi:MAG: serine hydrolase domain-containing protein [Candidatus Acidiferrales bacterium]